MLCKYRDISDYCSRSYSHLGYAYAISGETDKALVIIKEMKELVKSNIKVNPSSYAIVYSGLHDYDNAFKCLEEAADNHDTLLLFMNCYPEFAPIRSDPRFNALLKRMNLSE